MREEQAAGLVEDIVVVVVEAALLVLSACSRFVGHGVCLFRAAKCTPQSLVSAEGTQRSGSRHERAC